MNSFALYAIAMNYLTVALTAFLTGFMAVMGIKLATRLFGPIRIDMGGRGADDA